MEALWIILAIANIPVYVFIGYHLFGTWESFGEALRFWMKPDMWSAMDGEYFEDMVAELKLAALILLSLGAVVGEAMLIERVLLV